MFMCVNYIVCIVCACEYGCIAASPTHHEDKGVLIELHGMCGTVLQLQAEHRVFCVARRLTRCVVDHQGRCEGEEEALVCVQAHGERSV